MSEVQVLVTRKIPAPISEARRPETTENVAPHAAAVRANFLPVGNDEVCERWLQDPTMWERFLAWEVRACREPGALDAGTHILAVVRRTSERSR